MKSRLSSYRQDMMTLECSCFDIFLPIDNFAKLSTMRAHTTSCTYGTLPGLEHERGRIPLLECQNTELSLGFPCRFRMSRHRDLLLFI